MTAALLGSASPAHANEFDITSCAADRNNYSSQAFEHFSTVGMRLRRACNPAGTGPRGLVTANIPQPGRVEKDARSVFYLRAPQGTRITRFRWSGEVVRTDCRYALQLWAYGPDGPLASIRDIKANENCPQRRQYGRWKAPRTYDLSRYDRVTSIVQRIQCRGDKDRPWCASAGRNYISTFTAKATVEDTSPPTVSIVADNPFTRGEWVRGQQSVTYDANDTTGVKAARAVLAGVDREEAPRRCNFAQRIPCENGLGTVPVNTTKLSDGSQSLSVRAGDAADNLGASGLTTVRVDNTAPGAVAVSSSDGDAWRNRNEFDLSWVNPDEGDRAPIAAAHYELCRAGGADCAKGRVAGAGIQRLLGLAVPSPGAWQLRVWREDAAGNTEPANASVPVPLRFDPEPPTLGFEPTAPSDPTLVSVAVEDKVSGLASGQIEIRREGSGSWQALSTSTQGSRLFARVDDSLLPPGTYLLRATALDGASNQSSTDKLLDGRPMTINLPLRGAAELRAGVVTKRTVRRKVGRRAKRRTVRRRVTVLRTRARVRFGRSTRLRGSLQNGDGTPIAGAQIQVFSRTGVEQEQQVGLVQTDARGRYSYSAPAASSRTLRFVYPGTAVMLPVQRVVTLSVMGASTVRARPRRLANGGAVRFAGRLRSLPAPPEGKLVELQVELSGRWQTFRTTRTDSGGLWAVRYRFRRTCGLTRYRFRARLPAEAAYPYATGRTRSIAVRVRGRPCP